MTIKEHPIVIAPHDPHIPVWRYMDFTKFVSMLENKGLYFSRSDKLGDPFEGSFSRGNEKLRPDIYKDAPPGALSDTYKVFQAMRMRTFVNCWHMNEYESDAMWKLYSKTNEAIAIKSSYQQLKECLDNECCLGMIQYIDYESAWLPEGTLLSPYLFKRLSFSHENELRAVIQQEPIFEPTKELIKHGKLRIFSEGVWKAVDIDKMVCIPQDPSVEGIWKPVEIDKLINEIYVAPMSPLWFRELVEQIIKRYGISKHVIQSSLDYKPFFNSF